MICPFCYSPMKVVKTFNATYSRSGYKRYVCEEGHEHSVTNSDSIRDEKEEEQRQKDRDFKTGGNRYK